MTLQACARPAAERPATPAAVAVEVRQRPPAELLVCAERPEGFPAYSAAVLTRPVRDALIRLALAFGRNADRLDRLVNFNEPGTCPAPGTHESNAFVGPAGEQPNG